MKFPTSNRKPRPAAALAAVGRKSASARGIGIASPGCERVVGHGMHRGNGITGNWPAAGWVGGNSA